MNTSGYSAKGDWVMEALVWWPVVWTGFAIALFMTNPVYPGLLWVLVFPPLTCRILNAIYRPNGVLEVPGREARIWWLQYQLQLPFNRFPVFEEAIRLVPGLYSLWILLWGGKVSPRAFWAPNARVLDRQLVSVGDRSVIGQDVLISGHMVDKNENGGWQIVVAPVEIGDNCVLGAGVMLSPGVVTKDNSVIPATKPVPPFNQWSGRYRDKFSETR